MLTTHCNDRQGNRWNAGPDLRKQNARRGVAAKQGSLQRIIPAITESMDSNGTNTPN
jgi:hypothetical protein